jgi:hypothetical protein
MQVNPTRVAMASRSLDPNTSLASGGGNPSQGQALTSAQD